MNNSFINRVSAERRALAVINEKMPYSKQLTGLSRPAIHEWRTRVGFEHTKDISLKIIKVAELCQSLSDRSHETFFPVDASIAIEIGVHIENLRLSMAIISNFKNIDEPHRTN